MHQKAAKGIELAPIISDVAAGILPDHADGLGSDPVIDELGGVVEDEDRPLGRGDAAGGGGEVAGQDLSLADAIVVEEAVSGLGGGPILAGQRQACSDCSAELFQEPPQPLAQPCIGKGRTGQFLIELRGALNHRIHDTLHPSGCPTRNHARATSCKLERHSLRRCG